MRRRTGKSRRNNRRNFATGNQEAAAEEAEDEVRTVAEAGDRATIHLTAEAAEEDEEDEEEEEEEEACGNLRTGSRISGRRWSTSRTRRSRACTTKSREEEEEARRRKESITMI
jgi:hypothetical protein